MREFQSRTTATESLRNPRFGANARFQRKHGGLGLGLAIVRHIVEMHGGSVSVDSRGKGQGSTFTIKLPLLVAEESLSGDFKVHRQGVSGESFHLGPGP